MPPPPAAAPGAGPGVSRRRLLTGLAGVPLLLSGSTACTEPGSRSGTATEPGATGTTGSAGASGTSRTPRPAADRRAAHRRLRELERSHGGRIGAVAIDTGTGATVSHRADEPFPLLSTFKVLAAAAVLDRARRSDAGLLDRRIRWTRADLVPHSPVTGRHLETGLTVAELCDAAITTSDNTAGNLLLKRIGGPAGLTRHLRSLGDRISRLDRWETELNDWRPGDRRDTTTPAAMARDLRSLTAGAALVPDDRARLIGWMKACTTGHDRIRAGLPKGWKAGDKTGTSAAYGAANDVAIGWPPSAPPLIITVYTHRRTADGTPDAGVIASATAALVEALRPR